MNTILDTGVLIMKSEDKLLNVQKVAEILGVSVRTIYQWSWLGQHLPFVKVGGALRISERDLMSFIEVRKNRPSKK